MSAHTRSGRRVLAAITALAMAGVSLATATSASAASTPETPTGSVIVFACADPAAAVKAAGGSVTAELSLIKGVAATLPSGASVAGCTVAANRDLHVSGMDSKTAKDTVTAATPTSTARQTLGLTSKSADGDGVTVAVVDTGVANSPDLAGRVWHIDMTRTSRNSDSDDYGHGTFVAGLIAGDGKSSGGAYQGAAPDAHLLDVRVADDDGSTSLVDVLRGLQTVAATQRLLNIKVLNLSLSSGSPVPYQFDPLSLALEGLWDRGITVVVPAGNDGPGANTISSPGNDPNLLTVGALDEAGTAARADDTVSPFSSRGPGAQGVAKPDVVAPGSHLVSLRAEGSVVDTDNPGSRIGTKYFRGSGTSMSTALTSGVVADLLDARPNLTPDQVKAILTNTAYDAKGLADVTGAGAGGVDANATFTAKAPNITIPADDFPKGQDRIFDKFSDALLSGDRAGATYWWGQLSPAARSWVGRSWVALSPEARSWVARSWTGRSWVGADGSADEWLARSWVARSWVARSWTSDLWSGRSWVARSWTARSWTSTEEFTARSWTEDDWTARSWTARSWTARSWTTVDWS
jgi:serine protease AprX